MKLLAWTIDRFLEVFCATVVIMAVSGPSRSISSGNLVEEFFRTSALSLTYYFVSGYVISCIYFDFFVRKYFGSYFPISMGFIFLFHLLFFFSVGNFGYEPQVIIVGIIMFPCVIIIHCVTQMLLKGKL